MKRTEKRNVPIFTILILALASVLLGSCGRGEGKLSETDFSDGILKIGVIDGNDRFLYQSEDGFRGIEADLGRRLAESMELQPEFVLAATEDEVLSRLDDGLVDIAFGRIYASDSLDSKYLCLKRYGKGGFFLITQKNNYIDNLSGLATQDVGITNKVPADLSTDIPYIGGVRLDSFEDVNRMAAAVENGSIAAGICTEREALSVISDTVQAQEILNTPMESYCAVMRKGDVTLYSNLGDVAGDYMQEMAEYGGYRDVSAKKETIAIMRDEGGESEDESPEGQEDSLASEETG